MSSYKVRILVSCCFIAAVGLTVYRIGINSRRAVEQLNLIQKAEAAGDIVADLDNTAPELFGNYPRPASPPPPGLSRETEFVEFPLNRQLDTNCVETMWRSKLIKKQELTERGLKVRERTNGTMADGRRTTVSRSPTPE